MIMYISAAQSVLTAGLALTGMHNKRTSTDSTVPIIHLTPLHTIPLYKLSTYILTHPQPQK